MMRTPIAAALAAVDTFRNFSSRHAARTKRETLGALLVLLLLAAAQAASAQTFTPRIAIVNDGAGSTEATVQTGGATAGDEITVRLLIDVEGATTTDGSDSYVYGIGGVIEFSFTSSSSSAPSASDIDGWIDSMITGFSADDDYRKLYDDSEFTAGSTWTEGVPSSDPFNFRLLGGSPDEDSVFVLYIDDSNGAEPRGAWCIASSGGCTIAVGDFTFTLPADIGAGTLELVYSDLGAEGARILGVPDGATINASGASETATYNVTTASRLDLDAPSDQHYNVDIEITPPRFPRAGGGTKPYAYDLTVSEGALPPGLNLTEGGAGTLPTLTGTPTDAGDATLTYSVTDAASASVSRTFTVTVTVVDTVSICSRTEQVRDEILFRIDPGGETDCGAVTSLQLSEITTLSLDNESISSLKEDDFSGLGSLEILWLYGNQLTGLPDGVFNGLGSLKQLFLYDNQLATLLDGVFSDLSSLERLGLRNNQLATLSSVVFSGLGSLEELDLTNNQLTTLLDDSVFSGLRSLERLYLGNNPFTRISAGVIPSSVTTLEIDLTPVGTLLPLTVANDATVDVSAAFISSDASDGARALTYAVESNDASVVTATVTLAGVVSLTPVGDGAAIVTVTANEGTRSATQEIAVTVMDAFLSVTADVNGDGALDENDALVMYFSYNPIFEGARNRRLDQLMGHLTTTNVPTAQGLLDSANDFKTRQGF